MIANECQSCRPVFPLEIQIAAPSMPEPEAQHLLRTTQHTLDDLNEFSAHHLRLKLWNDEENLREDRLQEKPDTALTIRLVPQDKLPAPRSELRPETTQLDVFYSPNQSPVPSSSNSPLSAFIAEEVQNLFSEEKATIAHVLSNGNTQLSETVSRRLRRSMKYADTYHLAFSLFTPGAAPSSWDIQGAIEGYMSPLLQALSPISNFTVDTQVQLYATFAPSTPA